MCHQKRGQIGGRDSLGDCDNICEGNLVFRVIFGKFMHRWFQICAQLGSLNVFFSHHRPPLHNLGCLRPEEKENYFHFQRILQRNKFVGITNANMWQTPNRDANTLVTCRIWGIRSPATLDRASTLLILQYTMYSEM